MPRQMPRFDATLLREARSSLELTTAGESSVISGSLERWPPYKLESLYEVAFLRVFIAWEMCLESIFYRSLCGYSTRAGVETLVAGKPYCSIGKAETAVLGGWPYCHWYGPPDVLKRCRKHIVPNSPATPHCVGQMETVISSNSHRLQQFAAVRHRIAHGQADAMRKFDAATMSLAHRTYGASRAGRFLRDRDRTLSPPKTFLHVIADELCGLASQLV